MPKSPAKLTVEKLTPSALGKIARQWEASGASKTSIARITGGKGNPKISWCLVKDDAGKTLAVFDIRDAIAHMKNMEVIFNPKLDFNFAGQSFEAVKESLALLIDILYRVFKYVRKLCDERGTVKIRNDSRYVEVIFFSFAKTLREKNPAYAVKFYRKHWIEITNTNGGGA